MSAVVSSIRSIARRSAVWCCALLAWGVDACSSPRFDAASEATRLLQIDAEWASLAEEGRDVEKIVSYWTDDATVMFPGQPVLKGKAALRAYVDNSLKT